MTRRLIVEADGGSRGNPGVAGYGALVRDPESGKILIERAAPLGKESNNVAEYTGLIAGLEAAYALEPGADVDVAMDSKLVVEQMSGRWKIKHEDMRRLALEARDIAAKITAAGGSVSYRWIPREQNKDADRLSNDGMDGQTIYRDLTGSATTKSAAPQQDSTATDGSVISEPGPLAAPAPAPAPATAAPGPTRVILVRHGVTAFTEQHRIDGRGGSDPDLSETGRRQAVAAAVAVEALVGTGGATVITSSLTRAKQTGAAIAGELDVATVIDADWDEQAYGDWDGAAMGDLRADSLSELQSLGHDPDYARPGGESYAELQARVLPAWRRVLAAGGTTVVVCHRTPILVVLGDVLGLSMSPARRLATAPGSLTAFEVRASGDVSVAFTNRT